MKRILICICSILFVSLGISTIDNSIKAEVVNAERYFYKQLSVDQKHIYDTIVASADVDGQLMTGTAKIPIDMSSYFTNSSATEADLQAYIQSLRLSDVAVAIVRDHPELFWIYFDNVGFSKDYNEGKLIISLDPTTTYFWDGITDEEQVKQLKTELNANVDTIIASCSTSDRYQTLKCINNWILENNKYNYDAANGVSSYQLAWSSLSGILSNNDDKKGPVCQGYAMAFKLLCDRLGIPCIIVEGQGWTSETNSEGHAWNYVQMQDGEWYAVDTTWNDVSTKAEQTRYFLIGSDTVTLTGSKDKFSLNHVAADNNYPILATTAYNGFKGVAEVDGTTYDDLQTAIDNANGKPIDLLAEVDLRATLNITSNITINSHGNTISNTTDTTISPLMQISSGASLTLYDDVGRSSIPSYKGDFVQTGSGIVIDNNGELILRSIMLDTQGTLISGNPHELGKHSVVVASTSKYINIGEVKEPMPSVEEFSVNLEEVSDKTTDGLLVALQAKLPTLTYAYAKGGAPQNPIVPTWSFGVSRNLVVGQLYDLTADVYGYTVKIPVFYGIKQTNTPITGSVSIVGSYGVGETVSANTVGITASDSGLLSYVWECDGNAIEDETSSTYTVRASDVGKSIIVKVMSSNYTGMLTSAPIFIEKTYEPEAPEAPVVPDKPNITQPLTGAVKIIGKGELKEILSVDISNLRQEDLGILSYQWEANASAIPNADSSTYTVKDSDLGKMITVKVSVSNYSGSLTSSSLIIQDTSVPDNPDPKPEVKLSGVIELIGIGRPNEVFSVNITKLTQTNLGTLSYQWLCDGTTIENATSIAYTIKDSDIGKSISAKVSAENYEGYVETKAIRIVDKETSDSELDTDTNEVSIKNENGNIVIQGKLPKDVKVIAKELLTNEVKEKTDKITDKKRLENYKLEKVFDIHLQKDNATYTLDGKVIVTIHLSDNLVGKDLAIMYIKDNGEVEEIASIVKGNEISFETTHFSTYAIVSKTMANKETISTDHTGVKTGDEANTTLYLCTILGTCTMAWCIFKKLKTNE